MKNYLILIILMLSPLMCYSYNFQNTYIQKNGNVKSLNEIILEHGEIEPIAGTSKYKVIYYGKTHVININMTGSLDNFIFGIVPNNIKVNVYFKHVLPHKQIYIDDADLKAVTSDKGNAEITDYYPEPGDHTIQLIEKNKILETDSLSIKVKGNISCYGSNKMKCKFME